MDSFLPLLVSPFLLSAVLQLAQGSRVVTAVAAAQILSGYPLDGLTLALLISAGAFMFSYISDPYFWLIKSTTGADMGEIVKEIEGVNKTIRKSKQVDIEIDEKKKEISK